METIPEWVGEWYLGTGEKIEVGASASYDVPMSDWYKMALDISPYTPPIDVVASLMAGHEVPPVE